MTPRACLALTASVTLLLSCSGSTEPVAGTLKVNLANTTNARVGAVLLAIESPAPPRSVSAATGLTLWGGPATTTPARVVVTGTITNGTILILQVDDINKIAQYQVTLLQVADPTSYQLQPLSYFSATVTK